MYFIEKFRNYKFGVNHFLNYSIKINININKCNVINSMIKLSNFYLK